MLLISIANNSNYIVYNNAQQLFQQPAFQKIRLKPTHNYRFQTHSNYSSVCELLKLRLLKRYINLCMKPAERGGEGSFVLCVFRRVKAPRNLLHYSPPLKKTHARQVALDKWFPLKPAKRRGEAEQPQGLRGRLRGVFSLFDLVKYWFLLYI